MAAAAQGKFHAVDAKFGRCSDLMQRSVPDPPCGAQLVWVVRVEDWCQTTAPSRVAVDYQTGRIVTSDPCALSSEAHSAPVV